MRLLAHCVPALFLAIGLSACDPGGEEGEGEHSGEGGEHSSEGGETCAEGGAHEGGEHEAGGEEGGEGEESGEENGTQYTKEETHDEVRLGVRLILSYDADMNAFTGSLENTTEAEIEQVRVEIHLSNGTELGPTPDLTMAAGEMSDVTLPATEEDFETWSAHAEVGSEEGCD